MLQYSVFFLKVVGFTILNCLNLRFFLKLYFESAIVCGNFTSACSVMLQFAKFRQLLKEVILLNDQLQKYTEKRLHLYAESCADECEDLPSLGSAERCCLGDADTDNINSTSVMNGSSKTHDSKLTEKRIVRITPATSAASEPKSESSLMIDNQESRKMQVMIVILCAEFRFCLLLIPVAIAPAVADNDNNMKVAVKTLAYVNGGLVDYFLVVLL